MPRFEYSAFISYAHKDKLWAKWLKRKLENSRFPVSPGHKHYGRTYEGAAPDLEELPCRHPRHALRDVFLDERNAGNGELTEVLKSNIRKSKYLIVICSPAAVRSTWVPREIAYFKEVNPDTYRQRIIPLIVEGRIDEQRGINECFPAGLDPSTLGSVVKGRNALHVGGERRAVRFIDSAARLSIALAGKDLALSRIAASLLGIDNPDHLYKSRRRAVRRRRMLLSALLATVLALCIGYYFRFEHTYTHYYANYVERNGIPVGIHPLRRGELPLQYQYYEFKIRNRRVRELRCKDSWGDLVKPLQPGIWNIAPWLTYEYTPQGLVSRIVCRDDKVHEAVVTFPGTSRDNLQLLAPSGESLYLINDNKKTCSRLHYIRTQRNARGEIIRMNFYTNADSESLGETAEGVNAIVFNRDSSGLVRSVQALNSHDNHAWFGKGVTEKHFTYDEKGRCTSQYFFTEKGKPSYNYNLEHALHYSGLDTDSITITSIGIDGRVCPNKTCYAFCSIVTRKETRTMYYLDRKKVPILSKSLVAIYKVERIPNGIRTICLDDQRQPILCQDGYAFKTIINEGDTTITTYYDSQLKPTLSRSNACAIEKRIRIGKRAQRIEYFLSPTQRCSQFDGSPIIEQYLNEKMVVDSCAFLNHTDTYKPFKASGFKKFIYDYYGNVSEIRRYDLFGLLAENIHLVYDERGNLIRLYSVDSLSHPVETVANRSEGLYIQFIPETSHEIRYEYNDLGQTITTAFYDVCQNLVHRNSDLYDRHGNLTQKRIESASEDIIIIRFQYDSSGRYPVEMSTFDRNLSPKEFNGIARTEYRYDDRGNIIRITHYNARNRPAIPHAPDTLPGNDCKTVIRNYCMVEQTYDERDNCIEVRFFDEQMRPYATETHGSVIKYRYNARDQMIEAADFHLGKPYANRDFHKEMLVYKGRIPIAVKYYDEKGKPANTSKGFAIIRIEKNHAIYMDVNGRAKELRYFADPLNRKYPTSQNGIHRYVFLYTEDGQLDELLYFDLNGQQVIPKYMEYLHRNKSPNLDKI